MIRSLTMHSRPALSIAAASADWPAVNGARALSREERGLLELVPDDVVVVSGGMERTYCAGLWRKRVRHALEHRSGSLRLDGRVLVAVLHGQEQRVNLDVQEIAARGAGAAADGPEMCRLPSAARGGLRSGGVRFFNLNRGGTYASRSYKED